MLVGPDDLLGDVAIASIGVMPQPTGQVDRISTIARPSPASWASNACRTIAFVRPIAPGSAIDPRASVADARQECQHLRDRDRIAGDARVAPGWAGGRGVAGRASSGELAAGHAIDAVVDEDDADPLAAGRGMDDPAVPIAARSPSPW